MPVATRADIRRDIRQESSGLACTIGSTRIASDPKGIVGIQKAMSMPEMQIASGIVVRSGVTAYDCAVKVGKEEIACNILTSSISPAFGVASGAIPIEGTYVFVIRDPGNNAKGWVIGQSPLAKNIPTNSKKPYKPYPHYWNEDIIPFLDNAVYNVPFSKSSKYTAKIPAPGNRPADILPGDVVFVNENGCGMFATEYFSEITGGASYVMASRLDDEIRMRSTNMTVWTDHQAKESFNDGGYISEESREYSYQGERLGDKDLKISPEYKKPWETEDKTPRPRVKSWRGFLGNLFSWFALRPKDPGKPDEGLNKGLISVHASQGGNVMVRAAGGVSMEKYDRIPVPERIKKPWDPEGDREKDTEHKPFESFEGNNDPHARALELSDRMAWEQGTMYKRFDELKKDFKAPNENDLESLKDNDEDPMHSTELQHTKNDKRRAGVYIGNDGSVILRDAWGSEIIMVGGNITINTPGSVVTTAHRNAVTFAGKTIALRGMEAVDISADHPSLGHVRVQSNNLVEIVGGSDDGGGGVLIESIAEGKMMNAKKDGGDEASIYGVVIRSEKSGVSVAGKDTYITGHKHVFVTGGPDGPERDGDIYIDGKNVVATAKKNFVATSGPSCLFVNKKTALVYGQRTGAVVGRTAMIFNGKKVPAIWVPIKKKPEIDLSDLSEMLQTSDIIMPYTWDEQVEKALFTFRTSEQGGTMSGVEPWQPNEKFTMYEPHWQIMVSNGGLVKEKPVDQKYATVHGSKPWPYMPALDEGIVKKLEEFTNIENGYSKKRDELEKTSKISEKPFSEYKY